MLLFLSAVLFVICSFSSCNKTDEDTLILVHTIFRHGDRTIDPATLYPNDPYINEKYYPYGVGQLTNLGKRREYNIGQTLRNRYDKFLGKIYEPDLLDARSTEYDRTKMSLQLVLAGLFPPIGDQIFQPGLYWQPIPFNYLPRDQDELLLGRLCPNYKALYIRLMQSERVQKEFNQQRELFSYLTEWSGWNITNYDDLFNLYFGLRSEREWGFELPEWAQKVYPQPLEDFVIKEYFMSTSSEDLKRLTAGYLLQKIIEDTMAKISQTLKPSDRKIFLYSAHESNIARLLITLGVFEPHIPPYGCYILVEVHKINDIYGIKLYYENYLQPVPILLKLPTCEEFCSFDKFVSIVEEYIPSEGLCGR